MAGWFLTEEAARKVKVNITIATGKETQTKIHRGQCGAITLTVQTVTLVQDGITVHPLQPEDKVLIGEIVLHGAQLTVAREVASQEVVHQEVHHLAVAEGDLVQGVGINSNTFAYENFKGAFARWNCFALCATSNGAEFY